MNFRRAASVIFSCLLVFLCVYLLWWRARVSGIRFFDVDEFSYLHWVSQVARGDRMYIDFYSYFTPGFFWFSAPLFWLIGRSAAILAAARMMAFAIFLGILGALAYLFGATRGWRFVLLPVVILAFLPMPYDKFLEIRPDNLAILAVLVAMIVQISAIRTGSMGRYALAGFLYSVSLFVLAKTLPIVLVAWCIAATSRKHIGAFLAGLCIPWIAFFAAYAAAGYGHVVWYSLTKLIFEASHGAPDFGYIIPTLFFYPNAGFYGGNGYDVTSGLIANHAFWILAIIWGTYRFVTPFMKGDRVHARVELLLSGSFFVSMVFYNKFAPLKHAQYLIPSAVFVAYYAADAIASFIKTPYTSVAASVVLVAIMVPTTIAVQSPKLALTNADQKIELGRLIRDIPASARVVDLEGKMFFWPEGYLWCCIPFDIGLPYESEGPPPLHTYLAAHPATYIYDGDSNRLQYLSPENVSYIRSTFAPVASYGGRLWVRK